MEEYKTITKEVKEHVITRCDICGEDIYEEVNSLNMPMLIRDVTIDYFHGESWPDDASSYHFEPDICPKCFREIIYPFILSKLNKDAKPWLDWNGNQQYDCMDEAIKNIYSIKLE